MWSEAVSVMLILKMSQAEVPNYSHEQVMQMSAQDIENILGKSEFPVSAALDRLSELNASWAIYADGLCKTLLHCAAEQGDCDSINRLLTREVYPVDVDIVKEKVKSLVKLVVKSSTPLSLACENGHLEAVKLLVQHGANVNNKSIFAGPVLFSAIRGGNMEIFDFLVSHGAEVPFIGRTCLFEAVSCGQTHFIDKLVEMGQDPYAVGLFEYNLLHEACSNPKLETLKKLLESFYLDPFALNKTGDRPIDLLIQCGDVACLELFISHDIDIFKPNPRGISPLNFACDHFNLETACYFLEKGVDPNIPDPRCGAYPIQTAMEQDNLKLVEALIKYGANIHVTDKRGTTLLTSASYVNATDIMKLLTRLGAKKKYKN